MVVYKTNSIDARTQGGESRSTNRNALGKERGRESVDSELNVVSSLPPGLSKTVAFIKYGKKS